MWMYPKTSLTNYSVELTASVKEFPQVCCSQWDGSYSACQTMEMFVLKWSGEARDLLVQVFTGPTQR